MRDLLLPLLPQASRPCCHNNIHAIVIIVEATGRLPLLRKEKLYMEKGSPAVAKLPFFNFGYFDSPLGVSADTSGGF